MSGREFLFRVVLACIPLVILAVVMFWVAWP